MQLSQVLGKGISGHQLQSNQLVRYPISRMIYNVFGVQEV